MGGGGERCVTLVTFVYVYGCYSSHFVCVYGEGGTDWVLLNIQINFTTVR